MHRYTHSKLYNKYLLIGCVSCHAADSHSEQTINLLVTGGMSRNACCYMFASIFPSALQFKHMIISLQVALDNLQKLQKQRTKQTKHVTVGKRPLGEIHQHLISIVDPIRGIYERKVRDYVKLWGCRCHRTKVVCPHPSCSVRTHKPIRSYPFSIKRTESNF